MQRRLLISVLGLACLGVCFSELPPLSPQDRSSMADYIVIGKVGATQFTDGTVKPGFVNRVYLTELDVESVEKGQGIGLGETIQCRYWKARTRPKGWTGPGGQYQLPAQGQRIRVFLYGDDKGAYPLLSPNGWEEIPAGK